jgi:uncharacterized protein (TIGR00730 family)
MGSLNDGCFDHGGVVKGVIHQKFVVDSHEHSRITDMLVSRGEDLSERKNLLLSNGDCLIALPGGVGTFDEIWDAVSHRSLGMKELHGKPICLLSIDGFYDGFMTQIRRAHSDGVLYFDADEYFHVESDPAKALEWCVKELETAASSAVVSPKRVAVRGASNAHRNRLFDMVLATTAFLLLGDFLFKQ